MGLLLVLVLLASTHAETQNNSTGIEDNNGGEHVDMKNATIELLNLMKNNKDSENSDEVAMNDLVAKANSYSISSGRDLNRVIVDGRKKFRIMKVAISNAGKKNGTRDLSKGLRNIKLKVESTGRKRVPNLFKTKTRVKHPYQIRRINRQIYRGEYNKYRARKQSKHEDANSQSDQNKNVDDEIEDNHTDLVALDSSDADVTLSILQSDHESSHIASYHQLEEKPTTKEKTFYPTPPPKSSTNPPHPSTTESPSIAVSPDVTYPTRITGTPLPYSATTPLPSLGPIHGYNYATRHSYVSVQYGKEGSAVSASQPQSPSPILSKHPVPSTFEHQGLHLPQHQALLSPQHVPPHVSQHPPPNLSNHPVPHIPHHQTFQPYHPQLQPIQQIPQHQGLHISQKLAYFPSQQQPHQLGEANIVPKVSDLINQQLSLVSNQQSA